MEAATSRPLAPSSKALFEPSGKMSSIMVQVVRFGDPGPALAGLSGLRGGTGS
jgi:hypothetical protein